MKKSILIFLMGAVVFQFGFSQNAVIEGYVFEDGGRGYLNQVKINIYESSTNDFIEQVTTNKEGFFTLQLPKNMDFKLEAYKGIFEKEFIDFSTSDDPKTFLKVIMRREEGYLFEVTLAPKRESEDIAVDAIKGALIEVYNNTKQEEVLVLENHPSPDFKIQFKKGNHYTVMVRKEGYLVKRMEAFVNVDGCILCFEGVGEVKPNVTDNLTEGLSMGTLLANVEMEPIYEGKVIELQNIYYEFGKATLTRQAREELKKLANILEDNKHLTVELGSHTDVRGTGPNNRALSEKRAAAAVAYLTKDLSVRTDRIIAVGYGESEIKNKCLPGVTCTDDEHGENRRTEIKVLKMDDSGLPMKSLSSMKKEEEFERMVLEGGVEQIKIGEKGEKVNDVEVENEIKKEKEGASQGVEEIKANEKDVDVIEEQVESAMQTKVVSKQKEKIEQEEAQVKKIEDEAETAKLKANEEKEVELVVADAKVEVQTTENVKDAEMQEVTLETEVEEDSFSGYRIVVHYSNFPISGDHEVYSKFDNLITYKTSQNNVLYMVGTFRSVDEAEEYREARISADFPGSYVVGFLKGKKITVE